MDARDLIVFISPRVAIRVPRGMRFRPVFAAVPWVAFAAGFTGFALLLVARFGVEGDPSLLRMALGSLGGGASAMMALSYASLSPWLLSGAWRPAEAETAIAIGEAKGLSWRMLRPGFLFLGAASVLGVHYLS